MNVKTVAWLRFQMLFCVNLCCAIDIFVAMFICYLDFEIDIIWLTQFYHVVSLLL